MTVIVFDLDDTLYLEIDFVRSGYVAVGAWLGIADFAARAQAAFDGGVRTHIFDRVLAELGLGADQQLVDGAVECYREHYPTIALAPDARRYLFHSGPRSLALLSDGYAVTQANKVAALGLDHGMFEPLVLTGAWGRDYWKPHPRGFELIEQHFGRAPSDYVYVADNPAKDFVAPRRLGWRTVQIERPGRVHVGGVVAASADAVIASLDELDQCLARLPV
jgi:putative hydrolase of the HAD superfamily